MDRVAEAKRLRGDGEQASALGRPVGTPTMLWLEATEARSELQPLWEFLESYARDLCGSEFKMVMRAVPRPVGGVRHLAARHASEMLALAVAAEVEPDCDVLLFNDWAMPVVQARALLEVPVTSISEGSLVLGSALARHLAIVTVAEGMRAGLEREIADLRLDERMCDPSVWWMNPETTHEEVCEAVMSPGPLIDKFDTVASAAANRGADAILVGCGYYGPIFARHGYRAVRSRPEVPVFDCATLGFAMARALYSAHVLGADPAGGAYPRISGDRQAQLRRELARTLDGRQS